MSFTIGTSTHKPVIRMKKPRVTLKASETLVADSCTAGCRTRVQGCRRKMGQKCAFQSPTPIMHPIVSLPVAAAAPVPAKVKVSRKRTSRDQNDQEDQNQEDPITSKVPEPKRQKVPELVLTPYQQFVKDRMLVYVKKGYTQMECLTQINADWKAHKAELIMLELGAKVSSIPAVIHGLPLFREQQVTIMNQFLPPGQSVDWEPVIQAGWKAMKPTIQSYWTEQPLRMQVRCLITEAGLETNPSLESQLIKHLK